ncbi:MAG TPA: hypothetical protein PL151_09730 [Phycisphaerae bacterium]|nr:hypothetical protein [Phycisphaerae bacterium]HOJ76178.1 hypothetical protein [Phycisphaerae bacterium]HOM53532.1 hypothetical protein [Phycisphaerae bacterium]HON65228.1 hypothetical protein [Phycisphaerae bacterium]HOQ86625.1 hypothetical protein [Phycisphaerae bacterium]
MSKRVLVIMLVALNLALLAGLILSTYTPPQAFAQGLNRSGEYLLVAAKAEQTNDAIYLVDLRTRQLHAFRSTFPRAGGEPIRVALIHSRDLVRDFGGVH